MYIYRDTQSGYRFGYKIGPVAGVQIGRDDPVSWPKKSLIQVYSWRFSDPAQSSTIALSFKASPAAYPFSSLSK
jgi:hypothetical protein